MDVCRDVQVALFVSWVCRVTGWSALTMGHELSHLWEEGQRNRVSSVNKYGSNIYLCNLIQQLLHIFPLLVNYHLRL